MQDYSFWSKYLEQNQAEKIVNHALKGLDDGELYLQHIISEAFVFDDGQLKTVTRNSDTGFGLRSVQQDLSAYAHSNDLSIESLKRASQTVMQIHGGYKGTVNLLQNNKIKKTKTLYDQSTALEQKSQKEKVAFLTMVDEYARKKELSVKQVTVSLAGTVSVIEIIKPNGQKQRDHRPMVRMTVQVTVERDGRTEQGYSGGGGRYGYDYVFDKKFWQYHTNEAIRQALVMLESIPGPVGEMTVVLGAGWPGVMLHEAVGHGLEGDFNRKATSVFSGRIGDKVAADGVTVIDDGTMKNRRGSLHFDDEGTPTNETVLIENGILKGYMQDRMNARLMNMAPTGNGRRESYASNVMPRMTNTYMASGQMEPEEIIGSVEKGIYAPNFGGGSVDITSGQFVFEMTEAYEIQQGKVGRAIKGATLIGNGPKVMQRISMVGNDSRLDDGIGFCGKAGQTVPVCVGQPTLKIEGITVGGQGG